MTTEENMADKMPQKIEADRLPFDAALMQETEKFMEAALRTVPEIGGLAVIPIWINPTDNLPPALLRLRNPQEPPMAALLQLIQNMCKFSGILDKELVTQYRYFDARVRELTQQLAQLSEQEQEKTGEKPE